MKRKVLSIIVTVIVTLALVLAVQWYLSPQQKLKRAVNEMELQLKAYQYRQAIAKINSQKQPQSVRPPAVPVDPNK
ncbi:MAG: hypothetical protein ACYTE3_28080 [Planctomycetota bacterium]|jgi:flagellar basal body-associated protein FliL